MRGDRIPSKKNALERSESKINWQVMGEGLLSRLEAHCSRFRIFYLVTGIMILCLGIAASFSWLGISFQDVSVFPLLLNLALGAPVALAVTAIGLMVNGRILGARIGFRGAFRISSVATFSSLLPVPAATLIHAGALTYHGATIGVSVWIVLIGHLTIIGLLACIIAVALAGNIPFVAVLLLVGGISMLSFSLFAVVQRTSGLSLPIAFVLQKLFRIFVIVLRLELSFRILGADVSVIQAAVLTAALIFGASISVVPAGLGISEMLAAGLAAFIAVHPASAFLATAINRITTLAMAGFLSLALRSKRKILGKNGI